jgi:glyoxylase-like metal-dependent hydrolase (beta-lactamase superfamily II)
MRLKLAAAAASLAFAFMGLSSASAQTPPKPLNVKVFVAGDKGLQATATMVSGEHDMVVIDAPFTRAEAYRLAAEIIDSNKKLKAIFVTHAHPDHYFGLTVLRQVFPDAQIYAQPAVAHNVLEAFPRRYAFWAPQIGQNAPLYPTAPSEYAKPTYELEGQEIRLIGPMRGDAPLTTIFYVPSAKAVIVGDILVSEGGLYLVGTNKASRADWSKSIDDIVALDPAIIVPGHMDPGTPLDQTSVRHTRAALKQFEDIVAASTSVEDFKARYLKAYPGSAEGFAFNDMAETVMKEKAAGK